MQRSAPDGSLASRDSEHYGVAPLTAASRRIGRNSGITLASNVLASLLGLVALAILARGLGPVGLGRYYTVVVAAAVVQLLLEAGLSTVLTRRLARGDHDQKQSLAEANGLLLIVAIASVATLLLMGSLWGAWRGEVMLWLQVFAWAATACAAIQAQQFAMGIVRGFEVFKYEAAARVLQISLNTVLLASWTPRSADHLPRALAIYAGSHVIAAAYLIFIVQWNWPCRRISLSFSVFQEWLAESVPVGLSDMLRRLTLQIDHLLLSVMAPAAMLGIYSVAIRPLGPLSVVPRSLVSAMFPHLSRTVDSDPVAFRRTFATGMRLLWILGLPATVTVVVLAKPLILFLAGPEFLAAALPMRVLACILVFSYPSTKFRFVLTAMGRQRLFTKLVLIILLFQTALEAALIPFYGYMGACTGFLIGEILFLGAGLAICIHLGIGSVDWKRSMRALPPAMVMATALWFCLSLPFVLQLLCAGLMSAGYLVLCSLTGALKPEETAWVIGLLRSRRSVDRESATPQTSGTGARPVRLLKTISLALLYFPYVQLLRLCGPRTSVLFARCTATIHWLLTFLGAQRKTLVVIGAVRQQLNTDVSVSTFLRRYLINKHQNFAEWHTCGTRRGQRYVRETYPEIEGERRLIESIEQDRGAILLVYHFGVTGMGFAALNAHGYDARPHMFRGATYQGEVSDWMARAVMKRIASLEAKSNVPIIYHRPDVGFVTLLRILRRGGIVGMNGDGMMATEFTDVPFLGSMIRLPTGPARLAAVTGAPIIPMFTMPTGVWQHRLILHEPVRVGNDSSAAVNEATQRCAQLLEDYVRHVPWMWWTWRRLRLHETAQGSQRLVVRSLSPGGIAHFEASAQT